MLQSDEFLEGVDKQDVRQETAISSCQNTKKAFFLDLDGTLLDTTNAIYKSFSDTFQHFNLPAPKKELVASTIGKSLFVAFSELAPTLTQKQINEAVSIFRNFYFSRYLNEVKVYPGILQLLEKLISNNFILVLVTAKPKKYAQEQLDLTNLSKYFEKFLYGTLKEDKIFETKTKQIRKTLKDFEVDPDCSFILGDRASDIEAGKACGINTIGAKWGFADSTELTRHSPSTLAARPNEIIKMVEMSLC